MSSSGNGHFFSVHLSHHVRDRVKNLQFEELEKGKGLRFLHALRAIYDHLRKEPTTFGNPLYRLPAMDLTVYSAVVSPLVVYFAVHQTKPLVFVKGIERISE